VKGVRIPGQHIAWLKFTPKYLGGWIIINSGDRRAVISPMAVIGVTGKIGSLV
jgi:hypothetical protein